MWKCTFRGLVHSGSQASDYLAIEVYGMSGGAF